MLEEDKSSNNFEESTRTLKNFVTLLELRSDENLKKLIFAIQNFNSQLFMLNNTLNNLKMTRDQWLSELLSSIEKTQQEEFQKEIEALIQNLFNSICDSATTLINSDKQESLTTDHVRQIQKSFNLLTNVLDGCHQLCTAQSTDSFIAAIKFIDKAHNEILAYQKSEKLLPQVAKALSITCTGLGLAMPLIWCIVGAILCSNPATVALGTILLITSAFSILPAVPLGLLGSKGYFAADKMAKLKNDLSLGIQLNKPPKLIDKAHALFKQVSESTKTKPESRETNNSDKKTNNKKPPQ
jgi:hypothetical protein